MNMSIVEGLYQYFSDRPLLAPDRRLNIDFLPADQREYTVNVIPSTPVVKRYLDGSERRQQLFYFGSSEFWDQTALQNLENSGFYEAFSGWIEEQNRRRSFPALPDGMKPEKLECLTTGYLHSREENGNAKYQIQCRITYFKRGERK